MYPEIEPFTTGTLTVGQGNTLFWEECGVPGGRPAIVLHGGPGTGCSPRMRRLFDPAAYRTVLPDQRGSGRSRPSAADPATDLSANTTHHLVDDLEALRRHLGVERFVVLAFSWGCTLALAWAERHPGSVDAMVLSGVTTSRRSEIDWLYRGVAPLFPEAWERFAGGVPPAERHDLVEAYRRRLEDPDAGVRASAAEAWVDWELAVDAADGQGPRTGVWSDPGFRFGFARLVTHYFAHGAWLEEGALLRDAGRLARLPGVLVNGRLDLQAPPVTAWELSRAWPGSELILVPGAGHSPVAAGMDAAITTALDRFARR
ncbi:MAG TPA: prolyl aminopeptidase [Acidimicrobiales bacterium]|nr:prolyl aminopeptidase [Acidimicrobiales bacterium]